MNTKRALSVPLAAALLATSALAVAQTPSVPTSDGGVTPWIIPGANPGGNRTCAEVGYAFFGNALYYQCQSAKRNYPDEFGDGFADITGNPDCDRNLVTVNVTDGTWVDFTAVPDGVGAALVKGGNATNVYLYTPFQATADSGLASPPVPSGGPAGLSNIGGFCWNPQDIPNDEPGCYADETAWADGQRYTRKGNWAMYTRYTGAENTVLLVAGQHWDAGTVHFSAPAGGVVTLTIDLAAGWRFALVPVGEENGMTIYDNNVKVQDYASAPSGNPAPGQFAWKQVATGGSTQIDVPVNAWYGVHVDVERRVACPF